jgi:hypothetical protein
MFRNGVEIERRMLNDRYTISHDGQLVIMDVTDQGRHRPLKVARLVSERGILCELLDVHVVWSNENRITFTGDERILNEAGQLVSYKQSWLCTLLQDSQQDGCPAAQRGAPPQR